jgi:acetyl esterase/lipase
VFPPPEKVAEAQVRSIPSRDAGRDIELRVFVPPTVHGAYLHIHGGGWVLGAADQQDVALWKLARHANVAVVSVEYRLAPEDPFPAGPDDCEDAAGWLIEQAEAEFGTAMLAIGGESAGGHLAALTLLRLRDGGDGDGHGGRHGEHGVRRFAAANLVFGVYDLSMTPSQRRWGDEYLILSTPVMAWFYDCFVPGTDGEARRAPAISPLYADLTGLPPALFTVGQRDMLLDDTLFMAARWEQAGNATGLNVYPESLHGFTAFPTGLARKAVEAQIDFVAAAVAP